MLRPANRLSYAPCAVSCRHSPSRLAHVSPAIYSPSSGAARHFDWRKATASGFDRFVGAGEREGGIVRTSESAGFGSGAFQSFSYRPCSRWADCCTSRTVLALSAIRERLLLLAALVHCL